MVTRRYVYNGVRLPILGLQRGLATLLPRTSAKRDFDATTMVYSTTVKYISKDLTAATFVVRTACHPGDLLLLGSGSGFITVGRWSRIALVRSRSGS